MGASRFARILVITGIVALMLLLCAAVPPRGGPAVSAWGVAFGTLL